MFAYIAWTKVLPRLFRVDRFLTPTTFAPFLSTFQIDNSSQHKFLTITFLTTLEVNDAQRFDYLGSPFFFIPTSPI